MKPKCAVFLSTYNGERYLAQQIESILDQKDIDIYLMIRDDGSTDNTVNILETFCEDYRVKFFRGENIGYGQSFLRLLYSADDSYDCYAFSDQDDIWDDDKMIVGWRTIKELEDPTLYYCSQRIIDENGKFIREDSSLERITRCTGYTASKSNLIRGCTMVWNRKMQAELLKNRPEINRIREHDIWVSWLALCVGKVVFDNESHMDYRQIDSSVSPGASINQGFSFFHKIKVMKYVWANWSGLKYSYAEELEKLLPHCKFATCHYKDDLLCMFQLLFSRKYNDGVPLKWRLMSDLMIVTRRL
ncbi:MAG: glycosyltransferase [Butyrivibrio sp.]|uniref:glycosyltransferase n=1 Tax=Butyrivibrio sp. TaxID=28121 RepID=UPI0025C37B9D|nr:glycosyltransferase [Butyrivibrio sp.]MBQ6587460.1 glycosyltransferase [Butyrivibrio sp.]